MIKAGRRALIQLDNRTSGKNRAVTAENTQEQGLCHVYHISLYNKFEVLLILSYKTSA